MSEHPPTCPECGNPATGYVQHYRFVRMPRGLGAQEYMTHGEEGINFLGHVEVAPCGDRISPTTAKALGWIESAPTLPTIDGPLDA